MKGEPFTAGLPLFADRIADKDASCVARLKRRRRALRRHDAHRCRGLRRRDAGSPQSGLAGPDRRRLVGRIGGRGRGRLRRYRARHRYRRQRRASRRPAAACSGSSRPRTHCARRRLAAGAELRRGRLDDARSWHARRVAGVLLDVPPARTSHAGGIAARRRSAAARAMLRAEVQARSTRCRRGSRKPGFKFRPSPCPATKSSRHAHAVTVLTRRRRSIPDWSGNAELLPSDRAARARRRANHRRARCRGRARRNRQPSPRHIRRGCAEVDAILTPTLPVEPPPAGLSRVELQRPRWNRSSRYWSRRPASPISPARLLCRCRCRLLR